MRELNFFKNVLSPKVLKGVSIEEWFSLIKGSEYSEMIEGARSGDLDYDQVKVEGVPCVTYNFVFDSYKKNSNIVASTGLMYIDLDDPSFNPDKVDKSKVYAMYHSFGGFGWGMVVKVEGLTESNFKYNYFKIVQELGIEMYIDKNAVKASQYSVLSFDENIYVNQDPYIFKACPDEAEQRLPHPMCNKKKLLHEHIQPNGGSFLKARSPEVGTKSVQPLRFDNLGDIEFEGDFTVDWEGFDWIRCWIPMKKLTVGRNATLLSYCNNLLWLNPSITQDRALEILKSVNNIAFSDPTGIRQLKGIVESIFKYAEEGSLKPIMNRTKRKIVFRKHSDLTAEDKREIVLALCNKRRTEISRAKLNDIINNWDFTKFGKMSSVKIFKNFPINKKTVNKYWGEVKGRVATLNSEFKKNSGGIVA